MNLFFEKNQIFDVLRDDAAELERRRKEQKYKNLSGVNFLDPNKVYDYIMACMQLADGHTDTYLRYFNEWDIFRVFETLALKKAYEYQEIPPEKED